MLLDTLLNAKISAKQSIENGVHKFSADNFLNFNVLGRTRVFLKRKKMIFYFLTPYFFHKMVPIKITKTLC